MAPNMIKVVLGYVCVVCWIGYRLYHRISTKPFRRHAVTLLVLGDVGRSPRMMYHAQSIAQHEWEAVIVGYRDTLPIPSLLGLPHVHFRHITNPPTPLLLLPWVLRAPIRVLWQVYSVLRICLLDVPVYTEYMIVQNPPSIPTLLLAQIICAIGGTKLVVDWHNTGYSILAMRTGEKSPLVKVAKWFEAKFGQNAYGHLFVTYALRDFLVKEWKLKGLTAVLHDRPPPYFRPTPPMIQHELFHRIVPDFIPEVPKSFEAESSMSTMFTSPGPSNMPEPRPNRPALLVSSTSWTADEDFTPLLTALDLYQDSISSGSKLPRVMVVITGKGALRSAFEAAVAEREKPDSKGKIRWTDVCVRCTFLPAGDYPVLLGCADLGVSMHSSSSGRDLPMKVVDMFGCGVPVLAKGFACISELVKDGKNGRVWNTPEELGQQLIDVLRDYPDSKKLKALRSYFNSESPSRTGTPVGRRRREWVEGNDTPDEHEEWSTWDENWDRVMHRGVFRR